MVKHQAASLRVDHRPDVPAGLLVAHLRAPVDVYEYLHYKLCTYNIMNIFVYLFIYVLIYLVKIIYILIYTIHT